MFDNGLSEWVLVLVVALLVLGPQRALVIINMVGLMMGKAKVAMAQVQEQVRRELPGEEFEVVQQQIQQLRRSNVKSKIRKVLVLEEKKPDT
jgi:sec-independent protein translocase protein TatB